MKKRMACLLLFLFLFYLLLFPENAFRDSLNGVDLWFHTILPALLPFLILSNLLIGSGTAFSLMKPFTGFFHHVLGLSPCGGYAWFLGLLCGFPMGARLTADLFRKHLISQNEAAYLLSFSNQCSPMFFSTYVLFTAFRDNALRLPSLLIFYGSALLTGLFFRFFFRRFPAPYSSKKKVSEQTSYENLLDTSIMNGFEVITRLGGIIILFSILSGILRQLPQPFAAGTPFLLGLTEITTGIKSLADAPLPFSVRYTAILCCTTFGGISTLVQTGSMLQHSGLSLCIYFRGKLVNTAFTLLLCLAFLCFIV